MIRLLFDKLCDLILEEKKTNSWLGSHDKIANREYGIVK